MVGAAPAPAEGVPSAAVELSVLLPVYKAMPYLPVAVRDILKQDLGEGRALELVCAWDGAAAEDWDW